MGLEFSTKRYFPYSFHPMSVKRYEDIGSHGLIQAVTCLVKFLLTQDHTGLEISKRY